MATGTKQVIDIFTNYPNTQEVLKDYNRLLESRHLDVNPPDSSEFLTKTLKMNTQPEVGNIPRTITAKASTQINFDTRKQEKHKEKEKRDDYYGYQSGHFDSADDNYWNHFHDYTNHENTENINSDDVLESEYGTFESTHQNTENYQNNFDLQAQASINHVSNPTNLLDLNNFMEIVSHRPSFYTGSSLSPHSGNRRNKTIILPPDYVDFTIDEDKHDDLESDFGEIVSTTIDKHKKRKEKTELQTSVKLHEGSEKFLLGHDYGPLETIKNKTKHIANKFLSLFTVIQFANFKCQANSAVSQYEGTCYLASECAERNGVAMGMCAEGHGVCCVFRGTCGGVGSNNCTYFESPGYPNYFPQDGGVVVPTSTTSNPLTPDPRFPSLQFLTVESRQSETANALSCIFRVYKSSDNVRQMRIDFIDLELSGPTNGVCVNESLIISGSGLTSGVPPICGYNTGQHVLVDVSNLSGPLQLAVLANVVNRKRYKIRICQYTDGCSGLMNCLQSYSGVTGTIQSFNYDQAATLSRSMPGYFNNLNYAICIRRQPGYCSITYTNIGPNGVVYPFQLRNFDDDGSLTVPAGQAGAGVINCPDDYIVVNGIRLCGDRLNDGSLIDDFSANAPVTDTSGGPIIIPVRTNAASTGRGFKLFYTQNPCSTSGGSAGTPDPRI
ncbi:uncharacterized protein [Atheta coriaria]|uniref:uncharacterized protein n=1 Tax=Dalotia coriaria TaxID=877792 RepID=UPI0031F3B6ED